MGRSREKQSRSPATGRPQVKLNPDAPTDATHSRAVKGDAYGSSTEQVGYARPPKKHQFKLGQSGNPSGSRKGTKSEAAMLREILNRKVTIRQGDRARKIPLLEAMLLKSAEEALRGDLKATAFLLHRVAATQSNETTTFELSSDETEVMKAYAERLLKQAKDQE
jgi:hypothetical protein